MLPDKMVLADPGGNITALVFDEVDSKDFYQIGAAIQSTHPLVEQVLFVQKKGSATHGQMAGGEFCGNAARALGYILSNGKDGIQSFTISGALSPVTVEIAGTHAKLVLETNIQQEQKYIGKGPVSIVHIDGISHAFFFPDHPLFYFLKECSAKTDRWNPITHALRDLDLISRIASGLIFVEEKDSATHITPYIYVRDIETLYAETGCASASIALASLKAKDKTSTKLDVCQPSGEVLHILLEQKENAIYAEVDGHMKILYDSR